MNGSEEIVRWSLGNKIKYDVIKKMAFRAQIEKEELLSNKDKGTNIKEIHKEAMLRGERYKDIIDSVIQVLDIPNESVSADLGSGTGTFAALVSHQPRVKKVYLRMGKWFITDPFLCYELLSKPIFVCVKPRE